MPYKCTACGALYKEGSPELKEVMDLGGCKCGKKFLMYIKGPVEEYTEPKTGETETWEGEPTEVIDGTLEERKKRRRSIEWLERELIKVRKKDEPLYLGIETIRIIEEGRYMIDVGSLMRGKPLVIKTEEGIYYIDLPYAMKKK